MIEMNDKTKQIKKVTVDTEYSDSYDCPHCGESYINHSAKAGDKSSVICDGEDGCGKEFEVIWKWAQPNEPSA